MVVGVKQINKLPAFPVSGEELYRGLTPTETLLVATDSMTFLPQSQHWCMGRMFMQQEIPGNRKFTATEGGFVLLD